MSLSRKLIKNNCVDMGTDSLAIPVSPIQIKPKAVREAGREEKTVRETAWEKEWEEKTGRAEAQIAERLRQAERKAEEEVRQAEAQAEAIRTKAEEAGHREGLRSGREEGYQAGYREAAEKTKEMRDRAGALLADAHRETREYIGRTRDEIIRLAASMAKSIICYNVDIREESIVEMVKNALHQAEERKQVLFRCPAPYVPILQANFYQFEKICPHAAFAIVEDDSVKSPGCVIETEDQSIDLQIDKQLDNIVKALQEGKEGKE